MYYKEFNLFLFDFIDISLVTYKRNRMGCNREKHTDCRMGAVHLRIV